MIELVRSEVMLSIWRLKLSILLVLIITYIKTVFSLPCIVLTSPQYNWCSKSVLSLFAFIKNVISNVYDGVCAVKQFSWSQL